MGEFQAPTPVSLSQIEAAEVVIIRSISLHITFEEVPLRPPAQAQNQMKT